MPTRPAIAEIHWQLQSPKLARGYDTMMMPGFRRGLTRTEARESKPPKDQKAGLEGSESLAGVTVSKLEPLET